MNKNIYGKNHNEVQTLFYRLYSVISEQTMLEQIKLERIIRNLKRRGCSYAIINEVMQEYKLLNDLNTVLDPEYKWRYAFNSSAPVALIDIELL